MPLSVLLGVIAGLNEDKLADTVISIGALAVVGLPEFVTGVVLIQIFAFSLGWLPANSSIRAGGDLRRSAAHADPAGHHRHPGAAGLHRPPDAGRGG